MRIDSRYFTWTITAGEDLDDQGALYKAVSLDEGKIANDAIRAGGILLYGGEKDEHLLLGYIGVMHFVAGEDIGKGVRLTVRSGGIFYAAKSGEYAVGRCLDVSAQKGFVATGAFNFVTPAMVTE